MGTGLINVKISNLNLLLLAFKMKSDKYIIKTFFDKSLGMKASYKYPDGEFIESIYGPFDRHMILNCYNFPYSDIIPSYEAIKDANPHTCERMNLLMLEMLSAYDMMTERSPRKEMLLKTAIGMSDWLLVNDINENEILHLINKCQILKRQAKLTNTEIKILKRLQLENTANPFLYVALLFYSMIQIHLIFIGKNSLSTNKSTLRIFLFGFLRNEKISHSSKNERMGYMFLLYQILKLRIIFQLRQL
jgi:hypothetical protein